MSLLRPTTFLLFLLETSISVFPPYSTQEQELVISSTDISHGCYGTDSGAIDVTVTGGTGTYIFSWTGEFFASTEEDISGLAPGEYVLTVRDLNSTITETFEIIEPQLLKVNPSSVTGVSCSGEIDGTITADNVTGGTEPYLYSINGSDYSASNTFPGLSTGDYILMVKDANNCEASESITITVEDNTDPIVVTQDIIVQVDTNGTVSIAASNIDNGSSDNCGIDTMSLDIDSFTCTDIETPVTVTLTVTDVNGNPSSKTATITVIDDIHPSITAPVDVTVSANANCEATGVALGTASTDDNCSVVAVTNDAPTTYSLGDNTVTWTVEDGAGNTTIATQTVTVLDDTNPTITAPDDVTVSANVDCQAPGVLLGTPVSDDNCSVASVTNDAPGIFPLGKTTVTWTVKDGAENSAIATQTVTVEDTTNPTIIAPDDVTVSADADCQATGVLLGTPVSDDNCSVASVTNNAPTTYSLGDNTVIWTVEDGAGNTSIATQTVTVEDDTNPSITAPVDVTISANANCEATGVDLGAARTDDNCSVVAVTNNAPITYSLGDTFVTWTVEDGAGNTSTATQKVTVLDDTDPIAPELDAIFSGCEITLSVPTAMDNCGGEILATADRSLTFSSSGTIVWTFEDDATNTTEVVQDVHIDPISFTASMSPVSCNNGSDGEIQVNASGGVGNLSYSINNGSFYNDPLFSNLSAGYYSIRVRDQSGCIEEKQVEVTEPSQLVVGSSSTTTSATCFNGNDGSITVETPTGGTAPYQYSIDNINFQSSSYFENVSAGNHTIFIKDDNNCATQTTVSVSQPDILDAQVNKIDISCHGDDNGRISISSPTGGSGTYEYSLDAVTWFSSGTEITGLSNGSYDVFIRDAVQNNCVIQLENDLILNQPQAPLSATTTTERTLTYGTATGTATVYAEGGSPGYTYQWRREGEQEVLQRTMKATGLTGGYYEVTVFDQNGCSIEETVHIIEAIDAGISFVSLCLGEDDEIRTSTFHIAEDDIRGGFGDPASDFTFQWDFGEGAITEPFNGAHLQASLGDEFEVQYSAPGDKTITVLITDGEGVSTEISIQHYVGSCFEYCGNSNNFEMDLDSFFIGDAAGNPLDPDDCSDDQQKFLYVDIIKSANGYSLSFELNYKVTAEGLTREYEIRNACFFQGERIPEGIVQLHEVDKNGGSDVIKWECGETFTISNFNVRWTVNDNNNGSGNSMECGSGQSNMCYGLNDESVVSTPLKVTAETTDILCFGDSTGSITVHASGGTGAYLYSAVHENGKTYSANRNVFNTLPAGNYVVTVTEDFTDNPKSLDLNIQILQPENRLEATVQKLNVSCYGLDDGEAEVSATGGTGQAYTYLWNDPRGQTRAIATGLASGNYTVTITDTVGCQILENVEILQPEELTQAYAGVDQSFSCGFHTTTLQANQAIVGTGRWSMVNPASGGKITNPADPNSTFIGETDRTQSYELVWTITSEDGNCETTDTVLISFKENCSTLDFDGVDDYIEIGEAYDLSGSFSMEAWIKPESVSGVKTILSKRDLSNPGGGGYELIINHGSPTFMWNSQNISTSYTVDTQRWYHIAVTVQGSAAKIYIDGIEAANSNSASSPGSTPAPFLIGATYNDNTPTIPENYFRGWIEEVRIWNTALTQDELQFMMNQRLDTQQTVPLRGMEIPYQGSPDYVLKDLAWEDLAGYYQLLANDILNGITKDDAANSFPGYLRNITTTQKNTAPLPYTSIRDGRWTDMNTETTPWTYGEGYWNAPNSTGIKGEPINWNIVRISDNLTSGDKDNTVLGFLSEAGQLEVANTYDPLDETNNGQMLKVTHYLKLNGSIDLVGESQLVQTEGSILDPSSTGHLQRDQQGMASSYNYNYWTSPVSAKGMGHNSGYKIPEVMKDGTTSGNPLPINFGRQYHWADGPLASPIKISTYWIHKFFGTSGYYSQWRSVGTQGHLNPGEGFSMKGSQPISVELAEENGVYQNYVFTGIPNNGTISLTIGLYQDYLIGNPYPSAVDADEFIRDNLAERRNGKNIFNGTLYFWSHFSGQTHYIQEYIGGYATYNLSGGVEAIASDTRINATGERDDKIPKQFIPVGQGFFVGTVLDDDITSSQVPQVTIDGGAILFKNSQRAFQREDVVNSVFHAPENGSKPGKGQLDKRPKLRLDFRSPKGYNRQLLATLDAETSYGFDLGYDAPLIENNVEDIYWLINDSEFVIQGVPHFKKDQELPIGLKIGLESRFIISIARSENLQDHWNIFLKDSLSEELHDLRKSDYKGIMEPGRINDRFKVVFTNGKPVQVGGDEEEPQEEEITSGDLEVFYVHDTREIIIRNPQLLDITQVRVNNILGQQITAFGNLAPEKQTRFSMARYGAGVYIVTLVCEKGTITQKFILN